MGKQRGRALMMTAVASSAIVAACASGSPDPTETTRVAVAKGLSLADDAKALVSQSYHSGGMKGLNAAASAWNARYGGVGATSEYVESVLINIYTGEIQIRYSANLPQVGRKTLVLTPNLPVGTVLVEGLTGTIEWACVSATNQTAMAQGFKVSTHGTVPAQYASAQCQ